MQVAQKQDYSVQPVNKIGHMIAPLSSQSAGLQKAMVTNGIREVNLYFVFILMKLESGMLIIIFVFLGSLFYARMLTTKLEYESKQSTRVYLLILS